MLEQEGLRRIKMELTRSGLISIAEDRIAHILAQPFDSVKVTISNDETIKVKTVHLSTDVGRIEVTFIEKEA